MAPVFTPYLDIADLPEFALNQGPIEADVVGSDGRHTGSSRPSRSTSCAIRRSSYWSASTRPTRRRSVSDDTVAQIKQIIAEDNPT